MKHRWRYVGSARCHGREFAPIVRCVRCGELAVRRRSQSRHQWAGLVGRLASHVPPSCERAVALRIFES